jgi:hypothetical protein
MAFGLFVVPLLIVGVSNLPLPANSTSERLIDVKLWKRSIGIDVA